ncbi:MAG: hypothetical protein EPN84_07265, partial [Legionella sp.]
MIELNNLILNPAASIDPQLTTTELPDGELLNSSIDAEDSDEPISLDPNSFVILMAQVLTATQEVTEINTSNVAEVAPTITDVVQESIQQLNAAEVENPQLQATPEAAPLELDTNIAMTWINSESYIPPQTATNEQTAIQPTDLSENTQELLPEEIVKAMNLFTEKKDRTIVEKLPTMIKTDMNVQADPNVNLTQNLKNIPISASQEEPSPNSILVANAAPITANAILSPAHLEVIAKVNLDTDNPINELQTIISNPGLDIPASKTNIDVKTLSIPVEVGSPHWGEKFAEHIVWMSQQGVKSALIKVHPEDLGPIEISIKVVKNVATVTISSHSTHVCNIVDQSMPKLREMMAEQGLNLAEVNISADGNS